MSSPANDLRNTIRKLNIIGIATVVLLIGGVGGLAATIQLSGAVIASGVVVVETNVKKVQHPTGGIVGEIFVKQGSVVEAGQLLLRLDDTVPKANLGIIRSQLDELSVRQDRLRAERDGEESISFGPELLKRRGEPSVATAMAGEDKLLESRLKVRVGQRSQLRERIAQAKEEISGLSAQRDAKEKELDFISEELRGVTELFSKNLVSIVRFMGLQRDQARLSGERGHLTAEIARARGRISEIELQIIQLEQEFRNDVLKEIREIEGRLAELREKFVAAEDQLRRVDLRAPQAGVVHQLNVHTVGGVITNAETIMLIVPQADNLVIECKVSPTDVDQVAVGATAQVRIMAGNQRTTPAVAGVVTQISADLTREPSSGGVPGAIYFLVRIELSEQSVRLLGDLRLLPGMSAETFIATTPRTPLEYLLKPLTEQIARAFRER